MALSQRRKENERKCPAVVPALRSWSQSPYRANGWPTKQELGCGGWAGEKLGSGLPGQTWRPRYDLKHHVNQAYLPRSANSATEAGTSLEALLVLHGKFQITLGYIVKPSQKKKKISNQRNKSIQDKTPPPVNRKSSLTTIHLLYDQIFIR